MTRYFRAQGKGYNLQAMQNWNSPDGEGKIGQGVACTMSPGGLEGGSRFGGAWDALEDDDEVVVFEGIRTTELYDGYLVYPTREIARFTVEEWNRMIEDGSAWDWEEW